MAILPPVPATILSIELSTSNASVALSSGEGPLRESAWITGRDHSGVFARLQGIMEEAANPSLDLILVGSGPGSYGGVRVALAAADGLALAHGARVAAMGSWEALFPAAPGRVWVIANARRNGWVSAALEEGRITTPFSIIAAADMPGWLEERKAHGERIVSTESRDSLAAIHADGIVAEASPAASRLIDAWTARSADQRKELLAIPPAPIYVRPPHITPAKTPPWLRT